MFELRHLDVPQLQPLARRSEQRGAASHGLMKRAVRQLVAAFEREQVLLLRLPEFRAVDADERLPFTDLFAGEVHEDLFNPAFDARMNARDLRLVPGQTPNRAQGSADGFELRRAVSHADQLLLFRRNLKSAFGQVGSGYGAFFRINRN